MSLMIAAFSPSSISKTDSVIGVMQKNDKRLLWNLSSLHAHCLTKCVKQFRLGIAINSRFECSVSRGSVFRRDSTIRRDSAGLNS
jgi:hypothetical protein